MTKKKTRHPNRPAHPPSTVVRQAPPRPTPAQTDWERGTRAFSRGDYDSAISVWTNALRVQQEGSDSLIGSAALAEAHFRRACKNLRKSPAQSLADLKAATGLLPSDPVYLYHLGLAYHRGGDLANALTAYRESLRNDPLHYERAAYHICLALAESGQNPATDSAWELLTPDQQTCFVPKNEAFKAAVAQLAQGNFTQAEPPLRKAHSEFRGFSHYYLGVIAWRRGQTVEALAHWLSALNAGFDSPTLRQNLVSAYSVRGVEQLKSSALLSLARAGLKVSPDAPVLLKLRQHAEFLEGNRAALAGDWAKALEHWQAAARSNPKQAGTAPRELMSNIAVALEHLERWSEAADTWREIIRRRPRSGENVWSKEHTVQLWKHIDSLYARTGYFSKSVDVLRHAIKAQPDDLMLRLALAKRHIENQNWRSAKNVVLNILATKPNHPEARFLYAEVLDRSGDLDLIIDAWEQVLKMADPRYVNLARQRLTSLYAERADFYFSMEDAEAGTADYQKALQLAPDDPALRLRYGIALVPSNPEQARAQLEGVDLASDEVAIAVICAWHRAEDHAEAARWLKRVAKAKKPSAALYAELGAELLEGYLRIASGYFAQALEHLDPADPDSPRLLTMMAVAVAGNDQVSLSYDYANRALKIDPGFGPAHFNMGLWDAARGRRQAAFKNWRSALDWAKRIKRADIADGIEEAINLLEERYVPTLDNILDTIDPDGRDLAMRRLLGSVTSRLSGVAKRGEVVP